MNRVYSDYTDEPTAKTEVEYRHYKQLFKMFHNGFYEQFFINLFQLSITVHTLFSGFLHAQRSATAANAFLQEYPNANLMAMLSL